MADAKYAVTSGRCKSKIKLGWWDYLQQDEYFVGSTIDTNNYCLPNPLDYRDQEDRVGHCHLHVIPRGMDWAVPAPQTPLQCGTFQRIILIIPLFAKEGKNWHRRTSQVHSYYASCYSLRYLQKKWEIGKDVGVWYIPMRHIKLELWGDLACYHESNAG
jgi:hypothetical protein